MHWDRIAFIISLLIAGGITGTLAFLAYQRRRQPGAKEFMGLMISVTLYSFGYAFEITSNTLSQVVFWLRVEYLGIPFIPFFLIIMVIGYAGLEFRHKTLLFAGLLSISLTTLIMHYTNNFHHLFYSTLSLNRQGIFPLAMFTRGPFYWVYVIYANISLLITNIVCIQLKPKALALFRKQINIITWSSIAPWLGYLIYLSGLSPLGLDLNPFTFTFTGLIASWGLFQHKLFDLSPIARDKIFAIMNDGVIIMDLQDRIVDFNPAAQRIVTDINPALIGRHLSNVCHNCPELVNQISGSIERIEFQIYCQTSKKWIDSRLSFISSSSEPADLIGKMIILSDITRQKQAQEHLIQSEKMAVLGQLVANVAHELNTPLAAIKATAENIEQQFDRLWIQLPEFYGEIHHKELLLEILEKIHSTPNLTAREERDNLRKLTIIAQENNLNNYHEMIRYFVKLGISDYFSRILPILRSPREIALLEFILEMALVRKNVRNILLAEERTVKTVYALKSYSHHSSQNQPVLTDVRTGIETVLQIYENLTKNDVLLTFDIQPVPLIPAYPDELQQVWTNLIQNALQAMNGKGQLAIQIKQNGNYVMVTFTDNGPGIKEELLSKIFEPLFTTKKAGEGSGLGLTICQEIVEHHQGEIKVQSKPGQTEFSVYIPVKMKGG